MSTAEKLTPWFLKSIIVMVAVLSIAFVVMVMTLLREIFFPGT